MRILRYRQPPRRTGQLHGYHSGPRCTHPQSQEYRQQLQGEAKQQRQQLLRLAEDVRAWRSRVERAGAAGAADLAGRAEQHLTSLMNQGRALWADLEDLGRRFNEVERQLKELQQQKQTPSPSTLEKDWALFEAEQELEQLRRDAGLN